MLFANDSLGRFTVDSPLSCGGMGQTWLARDAAHARAVVLKTIRADLSDDDEMKVSFRREVELTARVAEHPGHPGLVRHIDHGMTSEGVEYMALEHVEGASLADLGALPVEVVALLGCDIAHALAYAHDLRLSDGAPLGLVHSDVSPQNILVGRDGCATLIDFGAAVTAADEPKRHVIGKPGYLSPEQSRGKRVDGRSDQYSLGIVLWEAIAGRSLFERNPRRKNVRIPRLHLDLFCASFAVDAVITRMLAADPGDRYASCADAAAALAAAAGLDDDDNAADARAWLADRIMRAQPSSATARTLLSYKTRPSAF